MKPLHRWRSPYSRDDFGRSDPAWRGGTGGTRRGTRRGTPPPNAEPRQRRKRGGRSRPLPLRWRGSAATVQDEKPEQRQRKNDGWRVTPPTLFLVHSPICLCTILLDPRHDPHRDPGTVHTTGQNGASQNNAASGLTNRIVLHIEYRSIAALRCSLVGAPSGSFCNNSTRSSNTGSRAAERTSRARLVHGSRLGRRRPRRSTGIRGGERDGDQVRDGSRGHGVGPR